MFDMQDNADYKINQKHTNYEYQFTRKVVVKYWYSVYCASNQEDGQHTTEAIGEPPSSSGALCPTCGIVRKSKETLRQHERAAHKRISTYECCGKQFASISLLTRHKCNVHNEEKTYKCHTCDKRFAIRADLARHVRREAGSLRFPCSDCSSKFESENELIDHIGTHGLVRSVNKCDVCLKTFSFKCNLYRHRKVHANFNK